MTLEQFDEMLAGQGGSCAVCEEVSERWHVDHCHDTGKVRGVLCHQCNVALGMAKDCPDRLVELAVYLEKHKGQPCPTTTPEQ